MYKHPKKWLALALLVCMLAAPAAGIMTEAPVPDNSEPITYRLMARVASNHGDWNEFWLFKEKIPELFNMTFEITQVTEEGWAEKKNLAFATGDLPDFFVGSTLTDGEIATYGKQGMLFPLETLISQEATPNIRRQLDTYPELEKALYAPDLHMYNFRGASFRERDLSECRAYINTVWAEELLGKLPETLDEFYAYLKAVKEADPDRIPVSGRYGNDWGEYTDALIPILTAFGFTKREIQIQGDEVIFVPADPVYKEFVIFMNKLYSEGLLDSEYFTQTEDQYKAKVSQGRVAAFTDWAQFLNMPDPELWEQWGMTTPLTSEFNETPMWPRSDVAFTGGFIITGNAQSPERLMQLVDWTLTDDGAAAVINGPKVGEWEAYAEYGFERRILDFDEFTEWEVKPEENTYYYPEDSYQSKDEWLRQVAMPGHGTFPTVSSKKAVDVDDPLLREKMPPYTSDAEWDLSYNILTYQYPYYVISWPTIAQTPEEADELGLIRADLNSYTRQMVAKMITGDESIDNWDAYIQGCKDRKLDRYLEIYNGIYDRYKELN